MPLGMIIGDRTAESDPLGYQLLQAIIMRNNEAKNSKYSYLEGVDEKGWKGRQYPLSQLSRYNGPRDEMIGIKGDILAERARALEAQRKAIREGQKAQGGLYAPGT